MTCRPFETNAPKRSANLSVNSELLRQARALNINLSELLEQRLIEVICEHRRRVWLAENRETLEEFNRRVERDGAFSDGLRRF